MPDGLVERGGQHAGGPADLRHGLPGVEQGLHLDEPLRGEPGADPGFGRHEERSRAAGAIAIHRPLHRDLGHAESAANVARRGAAVDDELAGEKAESGEVGGGVGEDGQVAVEVRDLAVARRDGQGLVELGGAGGKERQLDVRHDREVAAGAGAHQPKTAHVVSTPSAQPGSRVRRSEALSFAPTDVSGYEVLKDALTIKIKTDRSLNPSAGRDA